MRAPVRDRGTRCPDAPSGRASYALPRCPTQHGRCGSSCSPRSSSWSAPAPGPGPSFEPSGPCTADGSAPGAYPDLEALVPTAYEERGPNRLDSGRNCSDENLGSLAEEGIEEIRFAGGTWEFGSDIAAVLAVFAADSLTVDAMADWWESTARASSRTQIQLDQRSPAERSTGWTRRPASGSSPCSCGRATRRAGERRAQPQPAGPEDRSGRRRIRRLTAAVERWHGSSASRCSGSSAGGSSGS